MENALAGLCFPAGRLALHDPPALGEPRVRCGAGAALRPRLWRARRPRSVLLHRQRDLVRLLRRLRDEVQGALPVAAPCSRRVLVEEDVANRRVSRRRAGERRAGFVQGRGRKLTSLREPVRRVVFRSVHGHGCSTRGGPRGSSLQDTGS